MTSPQENIPVIPEESPEDITFAAREAALENMGIPPADIRMMLGQKAILGPAVSPGESDPRVARLRRNDHGRGSALPSDAELDPDFAPPVAEILARSVSIGPRPEDLTQRDKVLALADWASAVRRAGGDKNRAKVYAMLPQGHVPKGNPRV